MMNKKGFTLIELLAVIAIVAVLSIALIPNIIKTVAKTRKNNFTSEAREIYKTAKSQYVYDRALGNNSTIYQRGLGIYSASEAKELDLSNRENFEYLIKINADGQIVYFLVQDGNYKIELGDESSEVLLKDIY